jgi:GDP-4-dehydro-6-deoxy-D-mannose reductase
MRVLVTGATGFVGRWLVEELRLFGHEPIATGGAESFDVTDIDAVSQLMRNASPDAIVHLAGMSYAADAAKAPAVAMAVNEGGTRNVVATAAALSRPPSIVVAGSSEVYGSPQSEDLPLNEQAPTEPTQPYGISKLAQEQTALKLARSHGLRLIVTRSFNHTGPGQRASFVAPALARRVLDARAAGRRTVSVGNLDVRRDISDVRDVVRAYRLLVESLLGGSIGEPAVVNVGSGTAVSIRSVLQMLASAARVDVEPVVDPDLVRADEPALIVADIGRLQTWTGWTSTIPLDRTLTDLVTSLQQ